jgi:glycosyltransferase involved in cell wall biosynthesis
MIPDTEIHVNQIGDQPFIDMKRVVVHGFLPKEDFDHIFKQMDINMYISFTDCFPMTLIESMEAGIPALASDTSDVYSFDSNLSERLLVSKIDGPLGISEKIKEVIDSYADIQKDMQKYLPVLHEKVEASISEFLK